jgi:predicted dehydrogenase
MNTINWGILGTATIAVEKVIPAIQNSRYGRVKAIASRELMKAETVVRQFKIPTAYATYQDLLADPDITAVYIPLPNTLHVPWSEKAVQAGKHVLIEKPVSTSANETRRLVDISKKHPDLKIMEAFMYRFHPQWHRVKEMLQQGIIGELCTIHSHFSFFDDDPASIVNSASLGGGSLLDIGCYSISLSRYLFESEPEKVFAHREIDQRFNIDDQTSAIMVFAEKKTSTFTCATQQAEHQTVSIFGTTGMIEMSSPFIVAVDQTAILHLHHQKGVEKISIEPCDQYSVQADLFSLAILNDTAPPIRLEDAVANMRVLDAIVESSVQGTWINL